MAVRIPSWTDNTGAESVSNKLLHLRTPWGCLLKDSAFKLLFGS